MCRGFQQNERERLRIKAFYTHLSPSCSKYKTLLPDSLTLHYLPRINGSPLEVNGSSIRPDTPAFVTLHRVVVAPKDDTRGGVVYASRERVVVCEGVRFEVYVGNVKAVRGIFRADVEEGLNWKVDVRDGGGDEVVEGVREAEVHVAAEGMMVMGGKVEIVQRPRRRMGRRGGGELEEIPEEREEVEGEVGVCGCCECRGEEEVDGGDCDEVVEVDGVGWAVDVGIWVVCLSVGYLVSRVSTSKRLMKRKRFV